MHIMNDKFQMTVDKNIFLARKMIAETIFNTAKMEGVNTTFPETSAILDGVNVSGAKLDDITVILNLRDGWRWLLDNVETAAIDLYFIEKLNENVSRNESLAWGKLRDGAVGIAGTRHRPSIPVREKVEMDIQEILKSDKSATEQAIELMEYIMFNQLFWDGNKRTATLAANAVLIKHGAGLLSVPNDNLLEFNQYLTNFYDTGDDGELKWFLYKIAISDFTDNSGSVQMSEKKPIIDVVLDEIREYPSATAKDIAVRIGKTEKTVQRATAKLRNQGLIVRIGGDKGGRWDINITH